jgi:hypothetical protein
MKVYLRQLLSLLLVVIMSSSGMAFSWKGVPPVDRKPTLEGVTAIFTPGFGDIKNGSVSKSKALLDFRDLPKTYRVSSVDVQAANADRLVLTSVYGFELRKSQFRFESGKVHIAVADLLKMVKYRTDKTDIGLKKLSNYIRKDEIKIKGNLISKNGENREVSLTILIR